MCAPTYRHCLDATGRQTLKHIPTPSCRSDFVHGNYTAYYGQRRASAVGDMKKVVGTIITPGIWNDPRLNFLLPEWFSGVTALHHMHTQIPAFLASCI